MTAPRITHEDRCVASAAWAALGDALGFVSELTDRAGLKRRAGTETLNGLVSWKRRIGGRFGPSVQLPRGCYSDDTQLRLATGRAIDSSGDFDVEAFAKVELPVFTAYALGAGRGTMASASNLRRGSASWCANFYGHYVQGGGNGAAMRVQPHVWAHSAGAPVERLLLDVAKNTACTHGHPRAFAGAAFHALLLQRCLTASEVPSPDDWATAIETVEATLVGAMHADLHFATAWLPEWARQSGRDFDRELRITAGEMRELRAKLLGVAVGEGDPCQSYEKGVHALDALDPASRGSGTKTAILAAYLAWIFRKQPRAGLLAAANVLGSDTDTIGSMAGALFGAATATLPSESVADIDYITQEARRLAGIEVGAGPRDGGFSYPDLLDWRPPRTSLDAVGFGEDERATLVIAGLGRLQLDERKYEAGGRNPAVFRWATLPFGQRIFVKMRPEPDILPRHQRPASVTSPAEGELATARPKKVAKSSATRTEPPMRRQLPLLEPMESIDVLTQRAIASGFDPAVVGDCLLRAATGPRGIEHALAFASIIAKARLARNRRAHGGPKGGANQ